MFLNELLPLLNDSLVRLLRTFYTRRQAGVPWKTSNICGVAVCRVRRAQIQKRADEQERQQRDIAAIALEHVRGGW